MPTESARQSGTNPRALGTNPRALGTSPRDTDEKKWALRAWKRKQAGKPALTKRQRDKIERAKAAKLRAKAKAAKDAAKAVVKAQKDRQALEAMNDRIARMQRTRLQRIVRQARLDEIAAIHAARKLKQ